MTTKVCAYISYFLAAFTISLATHANAKEILIHEGPTISEPGLKYFGPEGERKTEPPAVTYIKQFYTDAKNTEFDNIDPVSKLPLRISATRAIELALASLENDYDKGVPIVTKLETFPESNRIEVIRYFLITIDVKGSEEHRVVLMNETVLEPRLKRLH